MSIYLEEKSSCYKTIFFDRSALERDSTLNPLKESLYLVLNEFEKSNIAARVRCLNNLD